MFEQSQTGQQKENWQSDGEENSTPHSPFLSPPVAMISLLLCWSPINLSTACWEGLQPPEPPASSPLPAKSSLAQSHALLVDCKHAQIRNSTWLPALSRKTGSSRGPKVLTVFSLHFHNTNLYVVPFTTGITFQDPYGCLRLQVVKDPICTMFFSYTYVPRIKFNI